MEQPGFENERTLRPEPPAPAPAVPQAAAPTATGSAALVRSLQQSAGNAAVARLLAGGGLATLMREPAAAPACSPAEQTKLDEILAGTYSRKDFHPDTGT